MLGLKKFVKNRKALADASNPNRNNLTAIDTSCTSGFNSRAHEFQQKFSIKKHIKPASKTKKSRGSQKEARKKEQPDQPEQPQGLVEISEEYDIQSAISGLTRNSQFWDQGDQEDPPPCRITRKEDLLAGGREDANDDKSDTEWPDDETSWNHKVQVTTYSNNNIHSNNIIHNNIRSSNILHKNSGNKNDKSNKDPMPEPSGMRIETLSDQIKSAGNTSKLSKNCQTQNTNHGIEVVLSPSAEPDGIKLDGARVKAPVEPSGTRAEAIRSSNGNNPKPSGRSSGRATTRSDDSNNPNRIVTDVMNVEVVYNKDPEDTASSISERFSETNNSPRRRSKSTSVARQSRDRKSPRKHTNAAVGWDDDTTTDSGSCPEDEKRRSQSMPRTLKRFTPHYLKSEKADCNEEPSSRLNNKLSGGSKSKSKAQEPPYLCPPLYIENTGEEITSTLGSQLDGCESQQKQNPSTQNEDAKKALSKPRTSKQNADSLCPAMSEPRVCVEFSNRHSGEYFPKNAQAENLSRNEACNYKSTNDENNRYGLAAKQFSDTKRKPEAANKASTIPLRNKTNTIGTELPNNGKSKSIGNVRIRRAITKEASRNLLLTPQEVEDDDSEDLLPKSRPLQPSLDPLVAASTTRMRPQKRNSVPVTPSPKFQSHRDERTGPLEGHVVTPVESSSEPSPQTSTTPVGRKDLIQAYLSFRGKNNAKVDETSPFTTTTASSLTPSTLDSLKMERARSAGSSYSTPSSRIRNKLSTSSSASSRNSLSKVHNKGSNYARPYSFQKNEKRGQAAGYDDASRYYQHYVEAASTRALSSLVVEKQSRDLGLDIGPARSRTQIADNKRRNTLSKKLMSTPRKRIDMDGSTTSVDQCRDDLAQMDWRSVCADFGTDLRQSNPSYSYCTDDDSSTESLPLITGRPLLTYEDELLPHNQFMKMQLGIGN